MQQILNYFLGKKWIEEFGLLLNQNNYNKGINSWLRNCLIQSMALFLVSFAAMLYLNLDYLYITIFSLCIFAAPFLINYFILSYKFEQRKRAIEKLVPDLLLQASIFPKGTPMIKIIKYLSTANYASLSEEFGKALSEINKGASVEESLSNIKIRNRSRILDRAINLLIHGYRSGADMSQTFKETAEDLLETNNILRERISALVVEKYTLLFAGGIIVPFILGLLVGLVSGLDFGSLRSLEIGMSYARRKEMLSAALIANQFYIAEYSVLASLFVANQENNLKKAFIYASILLPLSLIVYNVAQRL